MPVKVNLIDSGNVELWNRQTANLIEDGIQVICTDEPVQADFTFILGSSRSLQLKSPKSRTFFCIAEPPEIVNYPASYLVQFGAVIGPRFAQYSDLPNFRLSYPLLPNFVDVDFNPEATSPRIGKKLRRLIGRPSKPLIQEIPSENDLRSISRVKSICSVTSSKRWTDQQIRRLEFLEQLSNHTEIQLELYGSGFNFVGNKSQVLRKFKFQVALENSTHNDYWTEKLSDGLMELNHVFYCGAPNIHSYFTKDAVTILDLQDFKRSIEIIQDKIELGYQIDEQVSARRTLIKSFSPAAFIKDNLFESYSGETNNHIVRALKDFNIENGRGLN